MRISIIDADLVGRKRHRFPNLVCMKLSGYYKERGDEVVLQQSYDGLAEFDRVYLAKVFTDTAVPPEVLRVEFLCAVRQNRQQPLSGKVVVIGDGAVAMDAAITARKMGAQSVDLYCLESREEMPAFKHDIDDALNAGVTLHPGWGPVAVEGESSVKAITMRRCLSVFNAEGRFAPAFDEADTQSVEADAVIFAIGQSSDLAPFEDVVETERGRIKADPETFGTSYWKIFAAGDAVTGPSTVIAAIVGGR